MQSQKEQDDLSHNSETVCDQQVQIDIPASKASMLKYLEILSETLPISLYWEDLNSVILGCNESILKAIGGRSPNAIVGKTPYEFYPYEMADRIVQHNNEVLRRVEVLSQEEVIADISTGKIKYFNAFKAPLRDDDGNVIGLIGTSIDITAEKEADRLRQEATELKLKNQEQLLQEKEKLITLAHKVAHDISSPLSALNMMAHACDELKESKRIVLKRAIESILDVANNLLSTYRSDEQRTTSETEQRQPLLISDWIIQLLSEKKVQYSNHAVRFETVIDNNAQFAFAQMQASQFRRSMSNLINNAVDALANKEHDLVTIKLSADAQSISVIVQDNGKGMPDELIQKMVNRESFTEGKVNGHGIGLQQVWDTLDNNEGTITADSKKGEGTTIQLTFPRIDAASWIAQEIHLDPNSVVVILDDEESIHGAWDTRFAQYVTLYPKLKVHHFKQGQETLDFFGKLNSKDKERVVFLSDYELLRQEKNGLQIIEESGIKNTTLVTSYYANAQIRDKAAQLGVKILPKQMASVVPIEVNETRSVTSFLSAIRNRLSG